MLQLIYELRKNCCGRDGWTGRDGKIEGSTRGPRGPKKSRRKYLPLAHFRKSGTGRLLAGTLHFLHFDLTLTRRLDQTLAKFQSINVIQYFFGAYQMKTRRMLRRGLIRIRMSPMWWKMHSVAIWQILDSTAVSIFVDIYWLK